MTEHDPNQNTQTDIAAAITLAVVFFLVAWVPAIAYRIYCKTTP